MTKDADKFTVTPSSGIGIEGSFTILKNDGGDFPSEIIIDIRQSGLTLKSLKIHTSCSQPLKVGDQLGGVIVTEFFPRP